MAATGKICGVDGGLTWSGGITTKIQNWTINYEAEEIQQTGLGDTWEEVFGGIKKWGGTFTVLFDSSSVSAITQFKVGAAVSTADFIFDATATTDGKLSGTILITGATPTVGTGGAASTIAFTFKGSGAMTLTKAA